MNQPIKLILKLFALAILIKLLIPVAGMLLFKLGLLNPPQHKILFREFNLMHCIMSYFNSDSGWYRAITLYHYDQIPISESSGWSSPNAHFAFFPLFPFLIALFMKISGANFYWAAFAVNLMTLFFLIRIWVIYLYSKRFETQTVFRLSLLLLIFPFSLHLYFIYTESLYLLFLIHVFYHAENKQWFKVALFASLMVLTRPNGIMVLIPIAVILFEQIWQADISSFLQKLKFIPLSVLFLIIVPLTLGAWMWYQYQVTGDPLMFSHAQAFWHKEWMFPLNALFRLGFWDQQYMSVLVVIAMLFALYVGRKWSNSYRVLVWTGILLPLSAGSVISMSRYMSVLFPFYISMSNWVKSRYYPILIIVCILGQLMSIKWWFEDAAIMY